MLCCTEHSSLQQLHLLIDLLPIKKIMERKKKSQFQKLCRSVDTKPHNTVANFKKGSDIYKLDYHAQFH